MQAEKGLSPTGNNPRRKDKLLWINPQSKETITLRMHERQQRPKKDGKNLQRIEISPSNQNERTLIIKTVRLLKIPTWNIKGHLWPQPEITITLTNSVITWKSHKHAVEVRPFYWQLREHRQKIKYHSHPP